MYNVLKKIKSFLNNKKQKDLRFEICSDVIGPPSNFVLDKFSKLETIQGPFNLDDSQHFNLLLSMQNVLLIEGDVFEIGGYFGRSSAILYNGLKGKERLHICDAFEQETSDYYILKPSPEILLNNISKVNAKFDRLKVKLYECLSSELTFQGANFRFIHIDGGHGKKEAYFDLVFCDSNLKEGGIICVDDYMHPDFPGVAQAVDEFLSTYLNYKIIGDLNRHGARGRKIYLMKIMQVSEIN